ncbi:MAG: luciferase family protein [Alphaproteobacteria bacterium]
MKLALGQKGRIVPPPVLDDPFQRVAQTVASWPGVIAATHWHLSRNGVVDGADFYAGEHEIGHIHLNGDVHLATDEKLQTKFLSEGRAQPFMYGGSYAVWTQFSIRTESDADYAILLFQQIYEQLQIED